MAQPLCYRSDESTQCASHIYRPDTETIANIPKVVFTLILSGKFAFSTLQRTAMTWSKISFERQKLFDEVWSTPVTTLAKTYGLSDVGLRKICMTLDVPMPPRGHWAKLAAGKCIPKPSLHETAAPTTYQRMVNSVQVDDVLEERVTAARNTMLNTEHSGRPDYLPPLEPTAFSSQTKLVSRVLKGAKLEEGVLSSLGVTWADISVSPEQEKRAFMLVDRFAHELEVLGAKFENSHPPVFPPRRGMRRDTSVKRNGFILHGHTFFIYIRERTKQELIPPPPTTKKTLRSAREPAWQYRPPEYRYIPSGEIKVSIINATTYYENYKVEDSARGTIEIKVKKALESVADSAIRRNVENEVRAEREQVRQRNAEEWEVAKAQKDSLLGQLSEFEKMARDLDRARSLRRLIEEVLATQTTAPAQLVSNVKLIAHMADWLDPLVKAPWPEVDSVGDKNPFKNFW